MFRILFYVLARLIKPITFILTRTWDTVVKWVGQKWAVTLTFFGITFLFFDKVKEGIGYALSQVANVVIPATNVTSSMSQISHILALCNTFFPLEELFVFIVAYYALLIALTLLRIFNKTVNPLTK